MAKKRRARIKSDEPRGLAAEDLAQKIPAETTRLAEHIVDDGGAVLASYREPIGGRGVVLAALPIDQVEPTPFQRDLSKPHVERLARVIDKLGRFLDPIIAVRQAPRRYWTPNGNHRLHAMKELKARSITALVLPEMDAAYQILALNTERAHNLKEKSLEVMRMARALAADSDRAEADFAFEFEEPAFLTLGLAYEQRLRLAGSVYQPVVRRLDAFHPETLGKALKRREQTAKLLLELDDAVTEAVAALKARHFQSPYLKAFVVARCNPLRFKKTAGGDLEETLKKMRESARHFDPDKVKASDIQGASGPPDAEE